MDKLPVDQVGATTQPNLDVMKRRMENDPMALINKGLESVGALPEDQRAKVAEPLLRAKYKAMGQEVP